MSSRTRVTGEHVKEQGNVAFKLGDYALAKSLYTHAMRFDPKSHIYLLNRPFANLKLRRWEEAVVDASKVLEHSPYNLKALLRRSQAHRELGQWSDAKKDIQTFMAHGGDSQVASKELESITSAQESSPVPTSTQKLEHAMAPLCSEMLVDNHPSFIISNSTSIPKGVGAFATRNLKCGELILSEVPTFTILENLSERAKVASIESEVLSLSPVILNQYLSLHNSHDDCGCDRGNSIIVGIYATNTFTLTDNKAGICMKSSRFNHSCAPNARYSFNERKGQMTVHVLTDIKKGEEIFVMYIMGRGLYGTPSSRRQKVLRQRYHFTCACKICSLPPAEAMMSDSRRERLDVLWNLIPRFTPTQGIQRLKVIVQAVQLMKEEGYHADADDYTNDAGVVCAYHRDWESTKYWTEMTYRIRVEEFGEDSSRAEEGIIFANSL
ncbi:SET domain-containing protein 5 [Psilocybe cubensis]|uniref:SET domain-containing protein 5 n=1 Tax=Psilocybe cubensis TaxID=181762 RepID=A0ACB8H9K0_PSICU|nr:SET domain-containing protein 5 [Psilocybe cubensis]KAH9484683.1 SET domain-containing protein 5 [Psilocybe cubensis]